MPDVNVSVMIDGKTVFVHGAAGAPDANSTAIAGLQVALAHFRAIAPAPPNQWGTQGQMAQNGPPQLIGGEIGANAKGPTL